MGIKIQKGGGKASSGQASSKTSSRATIRKSKSKARQLKREEPEEDEYDDDDWEPEPVSVGKIITWIVVILVILGGAGAGGWFAYNERTVAQKHRDVFTVALAKADAANAAVDATLLYRVADEYASHAQAAFDNLKFKKAGEIWAEASKRFAAAEKAALGSQVSTEAYDAYMVLKEAIDKPLLDEFGGAEWQAVIAAEHEAIEYQETGFNWVESRAEFEKAGAGIEIAMAAAYLRKVTKKFDGLIEVARGVLNDSQSQQRPKMDALDKQLGVLTGWAGGADHDLLPADAKESLTQLVSGMNTDKARWPSSEIKAVENASNAPMKLLGEGSKAAQSKQNEYASQSGSALEVRTLLAGIEFRLIPPGTFRMGQSVGEAKLVNPDEIPHQVTFTHGLYVGKVEVTQDQWRRVMGSNPSAFQDSGSIPANNISWEDAQQFVAKLHEFEQVPAGTYRLLTEAEWEYVSRAGVAHSFCYGASLDSTRANFDGSQPYGNAGVKKNRKTPVAVASFYPNAWGIYDMHGNVAEWVADGYAAYPAGAATDPLALTAEEQVLRGGGWLSGGVKCRSSNRDKAAATTKFTYLGLRIARKIPEKR